MSPWFASIHNRGAPLVKRRADGHVRLRFNIKIQLSVSDLCNIVDEFVWEILDMKKYRILLSLVFTGVALLVGSCSTNPVTGKNELSFVGEDWELQVGKQQYAPARQSQGGDYLADPVIQRYVNKVGQRVAAVSDRKLPYEFKVINSGVPNAWALPGGKIAINRGLLTELQSEAELAAVLGHEVVHAAAKHGAKGMTRGVLLQGGLLAATIASSGKEYSNLAQLGASVGAQLINTRYGRDAERESDEFGIKYMVAAGYDPQGAVDLQRTFLELSKDRRQDFITGLFASHPPSAERLANNQKLVAELNVGGEVGRERYQNTMSRLIQSKPAYEAYDKAKKAFADKDYAGARALVRRAINIEPNEGHFHSMLGDMELEASNPRAALSHYDNAIRANNNFFYYHLQKGLASEELRDYRNATVSLNRSVELLPTANAHNALGNIARVGGNRERAVSHYTKAAGHKSPAGQQALGSLVDLDLPANPGKYIATKPQVERDGTLSVLIQNSTPRNVDGVVLKVVYPANGQLVEKTERVNGLLAAGKTERINLRLRIDPSLARNVKAGVVRAAVSRRQ